MWYNPTYTPPLKSSVATNTDVQSLQNHSSGICPWPPGKGLSKGSLIAFALYLDEQTGPERSKGLLTDLINGKVKTRTQTSSFPFTGLPTSSFCSLLYSSATCWVGQNVTSPTHSWLCLHTGPVLLEAALLWSLHKFEAWLHYVPSTGPWKSSLSELYFHHAKNEN